MSGRVQTATPWRGQRGVVGTVRSAAIVTLEPGAQEVDGVNAVAGSQVGLLLDDVPGVITPRGWAEAEPPRDVGTTADLAHRAVEDFELLRSAEPTPEVAGDVRCAFALRQSGRQRAHRRCGLEAVRHPLEVAGGERLKKKAGPPTRASSGRVDIEGERL